MSQSLVALLGNYIDLNPVSALPQAPPGSVPPESVVRFAQLGARQAGGPFDRLFAGSESDPLTIKESDSRRMNNATG